MPKVGHPDLTFPGITYGERETPNDLRRLLYRGGAKAPSRTAATLIETGQLGRLLEGRIELICRIHEALTSLIDRGIRRATILSHITNLYIFFRWVDESDRGYQGLSIASVEQYYRNWTDSLLHRVRVGKGISEKTACTRGRVVGYLLDSALGRSIAIFRETRLRNPRNGTRATTPKAEKQNLEQTFAFGKFLLDVADGLSTKAIWGPLPVIIKLRNGATLEEWSGLKRSNTILSPNPKYPRHANYLAKRSAKMRAEWEADQSFRTRYALINLRIQVEMHMFMAQPGVNLAQAHQLRMDQWRFKPSTLGYEVRSYKHRRNGPVVFEIYSKYREVFERYLKWRAAIFPNDPDGLLFPLLGKGGVQISRHPETAPQFTQLMKACKRAGIKPVSPSSLRSTNVNWMLRRTQDPDLTASEKQHSTKTLLGVYEKPSLQQALVQTKIFWAKYDPAQAAAGPGLCLGKNPEPVANLPNTATVPDCQTPAGCFFCAQQRDIDSFDHIWSLTSYRLLKSFELRGQGRVELQKGLSPDPAELVMDRITAKLDNIKGSSKTRFGWLQEALLRIEEGRYHPTWAPMIESL